MTLHFRLLIFNINIVFFIRKKDFLNMSQSTHNNPIVFCSFSNSKARTSKHCHRQPLFFCCSLPWLLLPPAQRRRPLPCEGPCVVESDLFLNFADFQLVDDDRGSVVGRSNPKVRASHGRVASVAGSTRPARRIKARKWHSCFMASHARLHHEFV